MTFEELNELPALRRLIEIERKRVKKLHDAAGIKSPSLTGMPHGSGVHDRIAENIPAAVDLESEIQEQLAMLEEKRDRIESWIQKQPMRIRLITTLRYIDGLPWCEVADEVYRESLSPKSEDAVRKCLRRYIEKEVDNHGESDGRDPPGE